MKALILALTLLFTFSSFAREILILDLSPATRNSNVGHEHAINGSFAVNRDLGRAWLEIIVIEEYSYSQSPRHQHLVKLPGLSYNQSTQMVVLESEGQMFECASVSFGGRIFRGDRVKSTGSCKFKHRYVKVPYDDGYHTGLKTRLQVFLDLR